MEKYIKLWHRLCNLSSRLKREANIAHKDTYFLSRFPKQWARDSTTALISCLLFFFFFAHVLEPHHAWGKRTICFPLFHYEKHLLLFFLLFTDGASSSHYRCCSFPASSESRKMLSICIPIPLDTALLLSYRNYLPPGMPCP